MIRTDAEFASVFETVSEGQRRKMDAVLSLNLGQVMRQKQPFEEVMSEISRKAQEKGLTSEILDLLLNK